MIPGRVTSGATEGEIGLWRPRRGLEHVGRDAIGAGDGAVYVGFALPCFLGRGPDYARVLPGGKTYMGRLRVLIR